MRKGEKTLGNNCKHYKIMIKISLYFCLKTTLKNRKEREREEEWMKERTELLQTYVSKECKIIVENNRN